MDNIRLFLMASLVFVGLLLWQAWQKDYGQLPQDTVARSSEDGSELLKSTTNEIGLSGGDLPEPVKADMPSTITSVDGGSVDQEKNGKRIKVITDTLTATIDTNGGGIRQVSLNKYPLSLEQPDVPIVLLDDSNGHYYISQGGFLSDQVAPNHQSIFTSTAEEYTLDEGEDVVEVKLIWSKEGIDASKTFRFHRDSYLIDITYQIKNNSDKTWNGRVYEQLQRQYIKEGRTALPTYTGAAVSTPDLRFEKIKFDKMLEEPLSIDSEGGWLAMVQHYFVTAILPGNEKQHYYSKALGNERYIIGTYGPTLRADPGETQERTVRLYSGPKIQKKLAALATNLELTKDYGVLWFIAKPIFQVMDYIHSIVGNWGWAIILVTVLIKLFFYPLSAMGYKSMAKMRKVQPRMMTLKERYGDDRAKMQKAMMDMYKEEKINPLGGCFPILIQIPVFLALYWVLLESVEIRQAPFMLWIKDLSVADPFFVLPLLMGASMYVQQKLNPTPVDPMQAKIMQFLPVIFTVFFAFFPAGLVLYWVANNILSIAQQWMITRQIEGAT